MVALNNFLAIPARETIEGAGARIKRALPALGLGYLDPFVLLDEFKVLEPAGFPEHGHAGFEIITYMLEGAFRHTDSIGHETVIYGGDVQWIRAGRGIRHSEMPGDAGINHGLQLWINLAKSLKDLEPDYKEVPAAELPTEKKGAVSRKIIIGDGSPVGTERPVDYQDIELEPEENFEYALKQNWSGCIYLLCGGFTNLTIKPSTLVVFEPVIRVSAGTEGARFALIAGEPLREPIEVFDGFVR